MADTILSGDFTIYYLDDNRQKRIDFTGGATETYTMNALYSALQDHFDEVLQMDDGIPMSAQTPVEYTIGIIDAGDNDPWYIDYETMQHMTSGALRTSSWTRVATSNTGIVVVAVTSNTIDSADVGFDITHDVDSDAGTLLEVIEAGATDYLVIRPDSSAAINNFDTGSGGLTCNAATATQAAAAVTGEQIWANLYSIGTIEPDTHIYLYQGEAALDADRVRVYSIVDSTQDWWSDGHIDIVVPIRDYTTAAAPIIDEGRVTVLARKYTTLYDNFEVANSVTSGGRNPIPLATAPDLNNTTGYQSITTTAVGVDDFSVGDEITGVTSGARAIITLITGTDPTYTFHYYLIDDPQTTFQTAAETITNNDATGSATKDANPPANQGPALTSWYTGGGGTAAPTVTFGNTTADIDDDGTSEGYGIWIDCNGNTLDYVYEWIKYTYRRGNTTGSDGDGLNEELYVGSEVYLEWTGSVTGTISEGADVTQETSGATGVIISSDETLKQMLLRSTRGTFTTHATTSTLTDNDNSGTVEIDDTAATFSPKKQAPLGTFAGGTFFGARGVRISEWATADENNFQLTDSDGNTRERPIAITLTVSNLVGTDETTTTDDRVAVFRLTGSGGDIDKTEYAGTAQSAGVTTVVVGTAIATDVPGKTTGGVLRIRDATDANQEYRLRYASWATSTFTLAESGALTPEAGTDDNTVVDTGAFTNAKRGDLIRNVTQGEVAYITEVTSANSVEIAPDITGQSQTDTIQLNTLPIATTTSDDVYVPLIDEYATSASSSASIVYQSAIYFRVKVRNVANATPIIPFSTDASVTSAVDASIATIRTEDTIYT